MGNATREALRQPGRGRYPRVTWHNDLDLKISLLIMLSSTTNVRWALDFGSSLSVENICSLVDLTVHV